MILSLTDEIKILGENWLRNKHSRLSWKNNENIDATGNTILPDVEAIFGAKREYAAMLSYK